MYYLCNSGAGLSMGKSRFFCVFQGFSSCFQAYFLLKIPVFEFKFQVFVLKNRYGLFIFSLLRPVFHVLKMFRKVKNVKVKQPFLIMEKDFHSPSIPYLRLWIYILRLFDLKSVPLCSKYENTMVSVTIHC